MRLVPPFSRIALAGVALACLGLLTACKGSSGSSDNAANTIQVSGTVTYTRIPLAKDANGVPLGLQTDPAQFTSLPARGILVRFWKSVEETAPDGSKVKVWQQAASDLNTSSEGKFSTLVDKGAPIFVEIVSRLGTGVRLLADPAGMNSALNQADRPLYLLRKGLDGTSSETNPTPATSAASNVTVDFSVGIQDKWWTGASSALQLATATRETQGTGSRVLGILDTMFSFQTLYGRVIPGGTGDILDLHYHPGLSEARGTYVEFDRTLFPQAFDSGSGSRHYFGSIRGASANDDAWDEAAIYLLLGRNHQAFAWPAALRPVGECLTHLAPDLALGEGLARGMAANLLKSPYLADTAGAGASVLDIRDRGALAPDQIGPYSGPNLGALCWDLLLKGNSITAPGTPSTWSGINTQALVRFFTLLMPRTTDGSKFTDTLSIFGQLKRLQEAQVAGEPVNLATLFPDSVLTPLLVPYGITWPRPTTGELANFLADWGTDPNSQTTALPTLNFSMAKAVQVRGSYPNASEKEVAYAQFFLTKDTAYNVSVTTQPASLPAGAAVEVYFPSLARTLVFPGPPVRLAFVGNSTTATPHFVRVRVHSPNQAAADFQATVQLIPAP